MPARRSLVLFDWLRFREMEPILKAAGESGDFLPIEDEEAVAFLETLEGGAAPEAVCNALVAELCATGEEVAFETGLPELILWLRKQRNGDEPAEWLGTLLGAAPNVADWFACDAGVVGLLTPEETQCAAAAFAAFRTHYRPPAPPRGLSALTRRFLPVDPAHAQLEDLMALVEEAARREAGLAALLEE